jgi:hypothetical protein
MLDNKPTNYDDTDIGRRNTIIRLLQDWNLLTVDDPDSILEPVIPVSQIKIVPHREKAEWILVPKYTIGKK